MDREGIRIRRVETFRSIAILVIVGGAQVLALGCALPGTQARATAIPEQAAAGPSLTPLYSDLEEAGSGRGPAARHVATPDEVLLAGKLSRTIGRPVRGSVSSPDGSHVAFIVLESHSTKKGPIWVARSDGANPYLLDPAIVAGRGLEWRPDEASEGRIHFRSGGRSLSLRPVLLDD